MYVLRDLWRGNITPLERTVRPESDFKKVSAEVCKRMDRFCETLTPEGRKQLEDINDLRSDMALLEEEDAFIRGFRLGARMMLDVVGEYKGQFIGADE